MSAAQLAQGGPLSAMEIRRWLLDTGFATERDGLLYLTGPGVEAAGALDALG